MAVNLDGSGRRVPALSSLFPFPLSRLTVLAALCLLAFAVRVGGLGGPPLSGDEAFSVLLAGRNWGDLLATLRSTEPNPPLHFVLLKLWMALAGRGEFAVRFPSAAAGVMVVPLTYELGRRLLGAPVGLVAALLAAVNPYLVWYDHFARAYSLLVALSLVSLVLAVRWLDPRMAGDGRWISDDRRRTKWGYVGVTALMLYAHYFAGLLLLMQNLIALGVVWGRRPGRGVGGNLGELGGTQERFFGHGRVRSLLRSGLHRWFATQAVVALLTVPWLVLVAPMLLGHRKAWLTYTAPPQALWRMLRAFSLGVEPYSAYAPLLAFLFGSLLVGGVVAARRKRPAAAWVLTVYLFGPLLTVLAISPIRPVFLERYLIGTLPAFLALLAMGLVALGWPDDGRRTTDDGGPTQTLRRGSFVALLALILLTAATATPYSTGIADWREVARVLEHQVASEDVVVQNYPDPAFAYYYAGAAAALVLPETAPVDRQATDTRLRVLLRQHRRLWLLPHRDPAWDAGGFVEHWLQLRARRVVDEQVAGHRLLAYEAAPLATPAMDARLDWRLGDLARLVGFALEPETARPGERLTLTLFWAPLRNTDVAYTVFVHLWDGQTIRGQKDGPPQEGDFPTTDWFPGDLIADTRVIPIDPAAPPGQYQLIAGLYRLETGERLPVQDAEGLPRGDFVPLTTVEVR